MRREGRVLSVAATLFALLCALLVMLPATGCTERQSNGDLQLTGTVVGDDIALEVPPLPSAQSRATVSSDASATTAGSAGQASNPGASTSGIGAQVGATRTRVTSVPVSPGDTVQAGDVVAVLDQAVLQAALRSAQTASAVASANVAVIDDRLGTAADQASDLASQTAAIQTTITDLQTTRSGLESQLAEAELRLEYYQSQQPSTPSTSTDIGTTDPIAATIVQLRAQIATLNASIAKIDEGIKKAQDGLDKLQSGQTALNDAQTLLYDLRDLAVIASEATAVGVEIAQIQLDQATVRAPETGTILETAQVGDVLAAGARVAVIRRQTAQQLETWVDTSESGTLALGQSALVQVDSRPGETLTGQVTLVGAETAFPPTSHSTKVVHMIRAVRVLVTLDDATTLAAGTPADVTISTR